MWIEHHDITYIYCTLITSDLTNCTINYSNVATYLLDGFEMANKNGNVKDIKS